MAPCLGSTLELIVLVGTQVRESCGNESLSLICLGVTREICPLPPATGRTAGLEA